MRMRAYVAVLSVFVLSACAGTIPWENPDKSIDGWAKYTRRLVEAGELRRAERAYGEMLVACAGKSEVNECAAAKAARKELQAKLAQIDNAPEVDGPDERACADKVSAFLAKNDVREASRAVYDGTSCWARTHNTVAQAALAFHKKVGGSGDGACEASFPLRVVRRKLEPSIEAEIKRASLQADEDCQRHIGNLRAPRETETASTSEPSYGSRSPYGETPAMLQPSQGYKPSAPSAPARRGDCGSFSASGQQTTMYQTGCANR